MGTFCYSVICISQLEDRVAVLTTIVAETEQQKKSNVEREQS